MQASGWLIEATRFMYPLSKDQQSFVQGILAKELIKAHQILKQDHGPSGSPLGRKGRSDMKRYIDELRDVLLSFDMSTPQLDEIAKQFG
jgi:hypothetical protein